MPRHPLEIEIRAVREPRQQHRVLVHVPAGHVLLHPDDAHAVAELLKQVADSASAPVTLS